MPLDSPELILRYLSGEKLFSVAVMTLAISLCSLAGGMAAGLVVALLQEARLAPGRWLAVLYLWLFRGTPVLFQLISVFNVLPASAWCCRASAARCWRFRWARAPTRRRSCAPASAPSASASARRRARWACGKGR